MEKIKNIIIYACDEKKAYAIAINEDDKREIITDYSELRKTVFTLYENVVGKSTSSFKEAVKYLFDSKHLLVSNNNVIVEKHYNKEDLIIRAKNIRNDRDFNLFIEHYKNYLENIMDRDIPNVNIVIRERIIKEIIDFINQIIKKGYVNENNLAKCLERLINTTKKFFTSGFYGLVTNEHIGFNYNNQEFKNNIKHYVFHELTHSITDLVNFASANSGKNNLGEYKYHKEQPPEIVSSQKDNGKPKIRILSHGAFFETIISVEFMQFLNEIMAESTACDLADSYSPKKHRAFGSPEYIETDWHTPYNQTYQQLGLEFIKTFLYPNSKLTERELFKILTIKAINDEDVGRIILKTAEEIHPESYKEDLHEITYMLGNICMITHSLSDNDVNKVRQILGKYKKRIKLEITPNFKPSQQNDIIKLKI